MWRYALKFTAPLTGLLLISIGTSFLGTVLVLKLKNAGVSPTMVGLLTSCFYAGYILGAFKLESHIRRVGHIRAYATLASVMGIVSILHGFTESTYMWFIFRFLYGFCNAGLFIVVESWLLNLTSVDIRGRILSLYMIGLYLAQALGQFLLEAVNLEQFLPYIITTLLASLSIIPICATYSQSPSISEVSVLNFKKLFKISQSGLVGALISGLVLGAIYGVFPMSMKDFNFTTEQTGLTMGIIILGGALLQYPMGKLSDFIPRRRVLFATVFLSLVSTAGLFFTVNTSYTLFNIFAFFFGGFAFVIYPIATNLACDYVEPEQLTAAIGGLLISYSIGATIGPLAAPLVMNLIGPGGLFIYIAAIFSILLLTILFRATIRKSMPTGAQGEYVASPTTTPLVSDLHPRSEEEN